MLHQDALVGVEDFTGLAVRLTGRLSAADRTELLAFLGLEFERSTAAELKGLLNREQADLGFQARDAAKLLRAVVDRLSAVG